MRSPALHGQALVEPRQGQQIVDQPFDPRHLGQHRPLDALHRLSIDLLTATHTSIWPRIAVSGVRELVRGVGDEAALAGEGLGEAVEHSIEGLGERPHLRRSGCVDTGARREFAGVDLGRRLGQPPQRRRRPRRNQVAGDQRDPQGQGRRHQEGPLGIGLGAFDGGEVLDFLRRHFARREAVLFGLFPERIAADS